MHSKSKFWNVDSEAYFQIHKYVSEYI